MQQSDQKLRPMDLVREKTDKIKCSLDNFRLMFKGYNKMRTRVLPKGVSMLMSHNNQDEDDEGPFKRGGIRGGYRSSQRRVSCPEDDVLTEIGLLNQLGEMTQEEEEYSSLPPMTIDFGQESFDDGQRINEEKEETESKKKGSRLRSNSLFEFLGKKETADIKLTEHRHSTPSSVDEATTSTVKSFKFIQRAEKRQTKRIPKGTFTSTTTGAILPSVLLTYQPSACKLPPGCNVLNEYDYYFQSNQMMVVRV